MNRWRVTFTKKVEFEFVAETETDALVEAMKLNLDTMPIDWEMDTPVNLTEVAATTPDPVTSQEIELDAYGRPIIDMDGAEDEEQQ